MDFVTENKAKFDAYRAEHPDFSYLDYSWVREGSSILMSFTYALSATDIVMTTLKMDLPIEVSDETIRTHEDFIFRIGLIEALSYWKAYCAPRVRIMCGTLSPNEIDWWKETWFDGMGEFRYRNGLLDVPKEAWVEFVFDSQKVFPPQPLHDFSKQSGSLVAFTGGKDSTLALALVRDGGMVGTETFFVKAPAPQRPMIKEVLGVSALPETIVVRQMHERLISLNKEGALNGHTPFSIVVAFLGMFAASLREKKYFIVANEASADQPTVPGTDINHQYSKSLHFEKRFQSYCTEVWPDGPQYFSLLRPFTEIGIITLLKKYKDTLSFISSCNTVGKESLWCGGCAKCLFAYMLIAAEWDIPFAEKIFGTNMFAHKEYLVMLEELTGLAPTRPFECVGTTQESLAILEEIFARFPEVKNMPLMEAFWNKYADMLLPREMYKMIACEFHDHSIPDDVFIEMLKEVQNEVCYG